MIILDKEQIKSAGKDLIEKMQEGAVFIYPTDTIYGIGCNACNKGAVARVREIKQRAEKPFSVIAPSKQWIFDNCVVSEKAINWIDKLPGPYTLILRTRNSAVADNVNSGLETLGVRIPEHWFTEAVKMANVPFVTTSVNAAGHDYMTSLEDIDPEIKSKVDYIFYDGKKEGKPSKIVDLTANEKVIERE